MTPSRLLARAALAVACAGSALSAQAAQLMLSFDGHVTSSLATGLAVGDAVSGGLVIDTRTGALQRFAIGSQLAPGSESTAALTPDHYTALYQLAQTVVAGAASNNSFTLDLEGLAPWSASDALALLADTAQLTANLDGTLSSFGYYQADAAAVQVSQLSATVEHLRITTVPEPGSLALVLAPLVAGLLLQRRQRRA